MSRVRLILLLLALLTLGVLGTGARCAVGQVTQVTDGDTFKVQALWLDQTDFDCNVAPGQTYTVRLIGIDTPETVHPSKPVECYGPEASAFTKSLLDGRSVCLLRDISCTDKYGRLLAYVWVDTDPNSPGCETFLDAELVKQGYARVKTYPPDTMFEGLFKSLECQAYQAGQGLWGACDYPPPAGCGGSPTLDVTPSPSPTSSVTVDCSRDQYNCGDFSTCDKVMEVFNACPGDPNRLDGDDDGIPCESLCG